MSFDPSTLLILTGIIVATTGLLLLFAWLQNRAHRALAVWGGSDLLSAFAFVLLLARTRVPDFLSVGLAFAVVFFAYAGVWAGARLFCGRPLHLVPIVAGPALWTFACLFPPFFESSQLRVILISIILPAYTLAAARELWRSRREHLISLYPMVGCLVLHATLLAARVAVALIWTLPGSADILKTPWLVAMAIEPMIMVIVVGFLQLSMAKERTELVQRQVAATDALTGVASRRAFLDEGDRRLKAAQKQDRPAALLLFDLDRFKQVNDSYGHGAGDRMLKAFAACAGKMLRREDLFGRIGGEEFAALLINTPPATALAVAERCRAATEKIAFEHDRVAMSLTVSVGIATSQDMSCDLEAMLGQADRALYDAKSAGRNCVREYGAPPATVRMVA